MAELTTDAAALSEAATNFDGFDYFFLFEDGSAEAQAAFVRFREAASKQIQELNTISENINRSGTQYQEAADDAASSLSQSMGFTPPDDGFDLKAMEPADSSEAATSFDRISSDLKSAIGEVDSSAGDLAGALFGPSGDAAGPTYFDGKFLTAHDLTREQVTLSDTGFDLV
jgi:hypothetical protein